MLKTLDSVVVFIVRILLALLVIPHGLQKLFGWFGGLGFQGTIEFFFIQYGAWPVITITLILIESVGMLFVLTGFWTRIWAAGAGIIFFTAMFVPHQHVNFYLHFLDMENGGLVYQILVVLLSAISTYFGAGKWGVDALWYNNFRKSYSR